MMTFARAACVAAALLVCAASAHARQEASGALRGQVTDELGGAVVGATVTLTKIRDGARSNSANDRPGSTNDERSAVTDAEGFYVFQPLAPGRYRLRASARGFADFEVAEVSVEHASAARADVRLRVALGDEQVTVTDGARTGTGPEQNLNALVLSGRDLDALPVGAGGLPAALHAIAALTAGPNGVQFYVDGFAGGRFPPREAIREVRINQNPFSAEFERFGAGRVEVLTKPGAERLHGGAVFDFNDESLNSRDPFAPARAPFQSRLFTLNLGGPVIQKKASFFADFERRTTDDNAVVNAVALDPSFAIAPLSLNAPAPLRRTSFGLRSDYQLTNAQTLVGRYAHTRHVARNVGVGNFVLPERAYDAEGGEHLFQLSHTAALGKRALNETRLQHVRVRGSHEALTEAPAVSVLDAFEGGGAQVGRSSLTSSRWELQNHTTLAAAKHALKFGGQLRFASVRDFSAHNFNGTYVFAGGLAPRLDAAGELLRGDDGRPLLAPVTSAERYRRTLLFLSRGLAPSEVRERGGGASQFYVAGGDPEARVGQWEAGLYVQDDWRVRPDLTLSAGLRVESQTNLRGSLDFAPRLAFAWSPDGAKGGARTIVRGGFGLFYERFNRDYTLRARRLDGTRQRQFIVADAALLDLFPAAPPASSLEEFALPTTTARVSETLRAPYTIESSVGVERQLTRSLTVSVAYTRARTLHALRSRNLNAPLPGSFARPFEGAGEMFTYESAGRIDRNQLTTNVVTRLGKRLTFYATYVLGRTAGDTDGADSFPVNSYDAAGEYARASTDARHGFYLGGWVEGPWGVGFSTLVFARTGLPFNVTTGRDANADSVFNERPALATDLTRPGVVVTPFGAFDLDPLPGQRVIPRNYANGPGFASVNLSASKTFAFDLGARAASKAEPRKFQLTLSANVENLFNRTNPSAPVGNLGSALFGRSQASAGSYGLGQTAAGNRRLSVQVALRF